MLGSPVASPAASNKLRIARWLLCHAVIPVALAFLVVRALLPTVETPTDPIERARLLVEAGVPQSAVFELKRELQERPHDLSLHRALLWAHFRSPVSRGRGSMRDDEGMRRRYELLTHSAEASERDLGLYGLGYFAFYAHDLEPALDAWDAVENTSLSGLALGRARALNTLGRFEEALPLLEQAVRDVDADVVARAHAERAMALRGLAQWGALDAHVAAHPDHTPPNVQGSLLLHQRRFLDYAAHFTGYFATGAGWPYTLVVLLAGALWVRVIRRWTPEPPVSLATSVLVTLSGALAAHFLYLVHDATALLFSVGPTGDLLQDAAYYMGWVGTIEEAVKLLPLALLALAGRSPRAPVGWVVLGCLSALGFATYENLVYAGRMGSSTVMTRSFVSTLVHVFMTGSIVLSLPEARLRRWSAPITTVAVFATVALVHGAFDLLASRTTGVLSVFAFVVFVFGGSFFMYGLGGAIRASSPTASSASVERSPTDETLALVMRHAFLVLSALIVADGFVVPTARHAFIALGHGFDVMVAYMAAMLVALVHVPEAWDPSWPRQVFARRTAP
ncbi:MAG: PrsW family intramembrane metalloprotease [Myxococcales bacterium]|nr:PrsW family intramembrane metalloprotease [Myxococcales bacterium]